MRSCILLLSTFLFFSCNDTPKKEMPAKEQAAADTIQKTAPVAARILANQQEDSVIHFLFEKDSSTLTAKGFIRSAKDHVTGYLPVDRKAELSALLIPGTNEMNIRFTQLILPDSTMDGPFGQKFNYTLVQKGMYKLIISPNNMANGKTKGEFLVRLKVK